MGRTVLAGVLAAACLVYAGFWAGTASHHPASVTRLVAVDREPTLTIYLRNFDPKHLSDRAIRDAIPAWQAAANGRFRRVWSTPRVRLVLTKNPPAGAIVADFTNRGPVSGALAYHTENEGRSAIVVYVGADDYYGYSDSVSFTHELFELLADRATSSINQGWPFPYFTFDRGQFAQPELFQMPTGQLFINEVCDPVEASHYTLHGKAGEPVWISDWVTPNWWNDEQTMPAGVPQFDAMGLVQQPFTILRGGYASLYVIDFFLPTGGLYTGWLQATNFRGAGRDPGGYMDDTRGRVLAG
jgi:hypothetical protein